VEATDGDEILEIARDVQPDLIILDMMMPGRSGIDVIGELRADSAVDAIPVLMLTARAQAADREAALGAGASDFLTKPFSPAELVDRVRQLVSTDR
jgi:DNA-binding response OmpR family regulator